MDTKEFYLVRETTNKAFFVGWQSEDGDIKTHLVTACKPLFALDLIAPSGKMDAARYDTRKNAQEIAEWLRQQDARFKKLGALEIVQVAVTIEERNAYVLPSTV